MSGKNVDGVISLAEKLQAASSKYKSRKLWIWNSISAVTLFGGLGSMLLGDAETTFKLVVLWVAASVLIAWAIAWEDVAKQRAFAALGNEPDNGKEDDAS